jgi:D-alanyl-lipoteichoic acid acyltransferase DltB (MBOAT superfamily)
MLFNSIEYLVFLVVVLALFHILPKRIRPYLLFIASCFFYMSWKPAFILLLVSTLSVCYFLTLRMTRSKNKLFWLVTVLVASLGPLAFFKYANFVLYNTSLLTGLFGIDTGFSANIILPLGISFYTFQLLSYSIDVYRKKIELAGYFHYLLYVMFFPQLIAGPIVRAGTLLPQLTGLAFDVDHRDIDKGLSLILTGLVKKVIIADRLAAFVVSGFSGDLPSSGLEGWLILYSFSFQIYFDFSGYSDIGIGSARLLGLKLPDNFNFPYIASNLQDFWRRWHITLSTWLRDYLYISLGGSRSAKTKTYRNIFITMALGGLWHGAAWTFVLWGVYHGVLLIVERIGRELIGTREKPIWFLRPVKVFVTYHLVVFGWLFFRAEKVETVAHYIKVLFTPSASYFRYTLSDDLVVVLTTVFVVHYLVYFYTRYVRISWPYLLKAAAYAALAIFLILFAQPVTEFIYFQF